MPLEVRMEGCGNTFVVVDKLGKELGENREARQQYATESARRNWDENFVADGFLFVLPGKNAAENDNKNNYDLEMEYYDIDRTKVEAVLENMCGNGIRCFSRYGFDNITRKKEMRVMTGDGIKEVSVDGNQVRVNMGPARDFTKISDNSYLVNTSLAHIVNIYDETELDSHKDLELAKKLGRKTRYDAELGAKLCYPDGFQVNFVNITGPQEAKVVTYEKGVEDLTLACGTGCTAVGYVLAQARGLQYPIIVKNRGGNVKIDFENNNLFLIGPADYVIDNNTNNKKIDLIPEPIRGRIFDHIMFVD